ncbi:MAG: ABC transporter ATP-binding protein [Thermofilum sp.]
MLVVDDLSVGYGSIEIVHRISFKLSRGEILVVVGPNGSGKSTLLKGIFGLARVFRGAVKFNGREITREPPYRRALLGMSYLPQVGSTFESLKVRENLLLAASTLPRSVEESRFSEVLEILPELKSLMDRKVRTLSGGERQMVALAMSLLHRPQLLLLDEPTAALAPKLASMLLQKVKELNENLGLTVMLVEQNATMALRVSSQALLMVSGEAKFFGPSEDLLENEDLGKMYLGLG